MSHFKTPDGKLHFLDDGIEPASVPGFPVDAIEISDMEAATLVQVPSLSDKIKQEIAELEATITPRRLREAVLGIDDGWLAALNNQIVDLRTQLRMLDTVSSK